MVDIERYSRQLLVPEIGVEGQKKIGATSVLVVGCGGLGSPVALYLAAGGIGKLGLVDYDVVETSNLHRQIIHDESKVGDRKTASGREAILKLNSKVTCEEHNVVLDSSNALDIIDKYDLVVDCSDNVATRYLLNDACVLLNKVLVSGSALRMEGQLTAYNCDGGPCYRCVFPHPPEPSAVTNCSDGGVLGVVPGIMGSLQALETLKIAAGLPCSIRQMLLLFDALTCSFRPIKLPKASPKCAVCGDAPTVTSLIDYVEFCGSAADDKDKQVVSRLPAENNITAEGYSKVRQRGDDHVLLDCRRSLEFAICALEGSENVPLEELDSKIALFVAGIDAKPLYVICRRGVDSQTAVEKLLAEGAPHVFNVEGGLRAWSTDVDQNFVMY